MLTRPGTHKYMLCTPRNFQPAQLAQDLRTVDEEAGCLAQGATDGVQRDQRAGDYSWAGLILRGLTLW